MGAYHLRDDGELLAGHRPRRPGSTPSDARLGGQAGGKAKVRRIFNATSSATFARESWSSRTQPLDASCSVAARSRPSWIEWNSSTSTTSLFTPGLQATAQPSSRAGWQPPVGSILSRQPHSATAQSPCTTGAPPTETHFEVGRSLAIVTLPAHLGVRKLESPTSIVNLNKVDSVSGED
jgi:hypothetical protein